MSYEGHLQRWCPDGHYSTAPAGIYYEYEAGAEHELCSVCGKGPLVCNEVDDTNCNAWGYILPVEVVPAVYATCNFGHRHEITPARYEVPTEEQLAIASRLGSYPPGRCEDCDQPLSLCTCAEGRAP